MQFAPGTQGSDVYDEAAVSHLKSFLGSFKGYKIASTDPLVIEYYSDTWFLDAEDNVFDPWFEYGYGNAPWHMMGISNLAEAAGDLAYSADKSVSQEIEWMNYVDGPSLDILERFMDQAKADNYIPYEATMGQFITAEEAASRYKNLEAWYDAHGHFWIGTGVYSLDTVSTVEKTLSLKHNPYHHDRSDRWAGFSTPKLSEVHVKGKSVVTAGEETSISVSVTFEGAAYPSEEIDSVKYLLFDAAGKLIEVSEPALVSEGKYVVTLSADTTAMLYGPARLEVVIVSKVISIPSFDVFEFLAE